VLVEITETPLAARQSSRLRGPALRAYQTFLDDLAARGCAALAYRVTGPDPLPRPCVKHLRGTDRVVVAFTADDQAWVVLIGPHDGTDPGRNVYDVLYELAGVRPSADQKRNKPPGCREDTGAPPFAAAEQIDLLASRARSLAAVRGRRQ
jgi:hypothetical protein